VREKKSPDFYVWFSVFSQKYRKMIIDFYYIKTLLFLVKIFLLVFFFFFDNIGYQCFF
jgi:hypothetical protein